MPDGADLEAEWAKLGTGDKEKLLAGTETPMPEHVAVFHVELHSMRYQDCKTWWDHLDWSVDWSRRIKLRGQTVTT